MILYNFGNVVGSRSLETSEIVRIWPMNVTDVSSSVKAGARDGHSSRNGQSQYPQKYLGAMWQDGNGGKAALCLE